MENQVETPVVNTTSQSERTKFCKHCGAKIHEDAVICTVCGRQVEEVKQTVNQPSIIINNDNNNVNSNVNKNTVTASTSGNGRAKNKWIAIALCIFLGYIGAHKFYEGKLGSGLLYFFTGGLFFVGVIIDFFALLNKPNPYYV